MPITTHNVDILTHDVWYVVDFSHFSALFLLILLVGVLILMFYQESRKFDQLFSINIKEIDPNLMKLINSLEIDPNFINEEDAIDFVNSKSIPHDSENFITVPAELINYQHLLNPVKLGILSLLNKYSTYVSAELREILKISWGKYTSHLNTLEKEELVVSDTDFVDNNPRKVVNITPIGISTFSELSTILNELVNKN